MAALLVGMSVMAVLMGALLPVWTHMATREKEEELIFRGNQYARAIGLFQRKFANTPPPTIDVLVEQRFLRKKYKDPITNDDFQPIYANQAAMPGGPGDRTGALPAGTGAKCNVKRPRAGRQRCNLVSAAPAPPAPAASSASPRRARTRRSRFYNGRDNYNEWAFVYVQTAQRPGQSGRGGRRRFRGRRISGRAGAAGTGVGSHLGCSRDAMPNGPRSVPGPNGERGVDGPAARVRPAEPAADVSRSQHRASPRQASVRLEVSNDRVV